MSELFMMETSTLLLSSGSIVVAIGLSILLSYRFSSQYRIEASLKKQGISAQWPFWSIPFLGHVIQFWHPERLTISHMEEPKPPVEYMTLFGQPCLLVADANLSNELWSIYRNWPKSEIFYSSMDILFGTKEKTLVTHTNTSKEWHRKRENVSRSFNKNNLLILSKYIDEQVVLLCESWSAKQRGIDVNKELTNLTLRVILFFIFGRKLSPIDVKPLQDDLTYMINFAWSMVSNPLNGIKAIIPGSQPKQASASFRAFVQKLIEEAKHNPPADNHLINTFLAQKDWNNEILENEIMTLIFAGHDTTAHSTTIALDQCVNHSTIIDNIRKEYVHLKQKEDRIDLTAFYYKMKWPTAAFKESLRLNPETPGGTIRLAPKDTPLGNNIIIPKGCAVLSPMWIYSHSVDNWGEDALEFKPERFLLSEVINGDKKKDSSSNNLPRDFVTFSLGKRNCVGMPLAYMEGSMLLGYILTNLDITIQSPVKRIFSMTLRAEDMIIDVKPAS